MALPHPDPDFHRLLRVLRRQGEPDRVPLVEFWCDQEMMEAIGGQPIPPATEGERALDAVIHFWYVAGFDYVCVGPLVSLPSKYLAAEDTAILKHDHRSWMDEGIGVIASWEDFDHYPWPRPEEVDYARLEYVGRRLPEGMKIIASLDPGGQMELLNTLMGYTGLSYALHDDPALVAAVADKVQALLTTTCAALAEMPGVGGIVLGDDMGFKTATMISPGDLRRYVFPCHRALAQIAHAHELPLILHSCGELGAIMDELIDDIGFDAKHSFEDVILPVSEAKRIYGARVALLGGIDMDVLSRASEEEVRRYTRQVIEACAPGGGWALGSGNTLANYIPAPNYLAMLDEGRRYGGRR
jgi:uroporphyrinogen decarboxylase